MHSAKKEKKRNSSLRPKTKSVDLLNGQMSEIMINVPWENKNRNPIFIPSSYWPKRVSSQFPKTQVDQARGFFFGEV